MIKGLAAISTADGKVRVEEITTAAPVTDEVLVAIKASGICHTDYDVMKLMPNLILGHEGAGIVLEVGPDVTSVAPGDDVMLNWAIPCGHCLQCESQHHSICEVPFLNDNNAARPDTRHATLSSTLCKEEPVQRVFNIGTLATHSLVPQSAVVKIDKPMPYTSASIIGCGVMTGYGSVVNSARVSRGSTVVVLGCGGVGLNVIQAAKLAGAKEIIAIDTQPNRLKIAQQFGATQLLTADPADEGLRTMAQQVKALTLRGADYAFECTAIPVLCAAPLAMVRNGGTAVQVSGVEQVVPIDMELFQWNKTYINPLYGDCNVDVDFPKIVDLYHQGDLLLDELVTQTYSLNQVDQAFIDLLDGVNAKGVIVMDYANG